MLRGMLAATLVAVVVLIVAARSEASPNSAFRAPGAAPIVGVSR